MYTAVVVTGVPVVVKVVLQKNQHAHRNKLFNIIELLLLYLLQDNHYILDMVI